MHQLTKQKKTDCFVHCVLGIFKKRAECVINQLIRMRQGCRVPFSWQSLQSGQKLALRPPCVWWAMGVGRPAWTSPPGAAGPAWHAPLPGPRLALREPGPPHPAASRRLI